jgi:transcription elongation factor GreB
MSRYRPPQKQGSKYITAQGHVRLSEELDYLWRKKRPHVTKILSEAAAEGDRSENAEYIYRKKQLREIDSRIRFLRKRLENMVVVDSIPAIKTKVFFGAWVTLESEDESEVCYRIVGPDEFDSSKGYISMDSPLGKALMGKSLDDDVEVKTPKGNLHYLICKISYQEEQPQKK